MAAGLQTGITAAAPRPELLEETAREMRMARAGMIAAAESLEVEDEARITAATAGDAAGPHKVRRWTDLVQRGVVVHPCDEREDFAIVFEDDTQEWKGPAAALPEERAAGDVERLVIYDPQALQVPAPELPAERVADDELMEPSAERVAGAELRTELPTERAADEELMEPSEERRGNGGRHTNGSTSGRGSNVNSGVESAANAQGSAGNAQGARGKDRDGHAARGHGKDDGKNKRGLCRYCHNSTEHGWKDCPLCLKNEAEYAQQGNAHVTQDDTTSQAWFMQANVVSKDIEDFAVDIGDISRARKEPAATQAECRATVTAAVSKQAQNALVSALPSERGIYDPQDNFVIDDPQALQAHIAVLPAEGVAGEGPAERPAGSAVLPAGGVAGDGPAEHLAGDQHTTGVTTESMRYTNKVQMDPDAAQPEERAAIDDQVREVPGDRHDQTDPDAAQPEDREAEDMQVKDVPVVALPEKRAAGDVHVQDVPVVAPPGVRAVCDLQVQEAPAAAAEGDPATITHLQTKKAPDGTEIAVYTASQVEIVKPQVDGDTTMLDGAFAEKGVMADLLSALPKLCHGNYYHHPHVLQQLADRDDFEAGSVETEDEKNDEGEGHDTSVGLSMEEPVSCLNSGNPVTWTVMNLRTQEVLDRGRRSPTLLCW
eukprot:g3977.t1